MKKSHVPTTHTRTVFCTRSAMQVLTNAALVFNPAVDELDDMLQNRQKNRSEYYGAWEQTNPIFPCSYMFIMPAQKRFFGNCSKQILYVYFCSLSWTV